MPLGHPAFRDLFQQLVNRAEKDYNPGKGFMSLVKRMLRKIPDSSVLDFVSESLGITMTPLLILHCVGARKPVPPEGVEWAVKKLPTSTDCGELGAGLLRYALRVGNKNVVETAISFGANLSPSSLVWGALSDFYDESNRFSFLGWLHSERASPSTKVLLTN